MTPDLASFVRSVLEGEGAATERLPDGGILALLSADTAARLERSEEYLFRTEPADGFTGDVLAYGTDRLVDVAGLALSRGRTAHAVVPVGYLKKADLEPAAREILQVSRAAREFGAAAEALVSYLVVHLHYRATSVDTREGLLSYVLNEATGARVERMLELVDVRDLNDAVAEEEIEGRRPVAALLDRARSLARREIEEKLVPFRAAMDRRLARDWERVRGYYAELRDEADRRRRRTTSAETSEKLAARQEAIAADLEAKRQDLLARYAIRVDVEAASVLRLYALALRIPCRLKLRRAERTLATFWNPVTKVLEPLFCEGCGKTVRAFTACDELHLACTACSGSCPTCGRRICRVCTPAGCRTCANG